MKTRLPTDAEKRLWREANQHTDLFVAGVEELLEETPEAIPDTGARAPEPVATPPKPSRNIPLPPLAPLSTREAKRLRSSYPLIDAVLDLHGLGKIEAHGQVTAFVQHQARRAHRHLLIITGKGRVGEGVLRQHVPHWLNEAPLRPLISALAYAAPEKGGTGALHVLLKRR